MHITMDFLKSSLFLSQMGSLDTRYFLFSFSFPLKWSIKFVGDMEDFLEEVGSLLGNRYPGRRILRSCSACSELGWVFLYCTHLPPARILPWLLS